MRSGVVATIVAAICLPAFGSGCATIATGTSQVIDVQTDPPGATCFVMRNGMQLGMVATPGKITVSKSALALNFECSKDGFERSRLDQGAEFASATAGNLLLGGALGIAVDIASGAANVYPSPVRLTLSAVSALDTDSGPPRESEAKVSTSSVIGSAVGAQVPNAVHGSAPFHCPASGTRVDRSNSETILHQGLSQAEPFVCVSLRNGKSEESYLGLWPVTNANKSTLGSALHMFGERSEAGQAFFEEIRPNGIWKISFRAVGSEDCGEHRCNHVIVLEQALTGTLIVETNMWFDSGLGVEVRQTRQILRGGPTSISEWRAIDVRLANNSMSAPF